jgi:hypothetical protein
MKLLPDQAQQASQTSEALGKFAVEPNRLSRIDNETEAELERVKAQLANMRANWRAEVQNVERVRVQLSRLDEQCNAWIARCDEVYSKLERVKAERDRLLEACKISLKHVGTRPQAILKSAIAAAQGRQQ